MANRCRTDKRFDKILEKLAKKDSEIEVQVNDALSKFTLRPRPKSLDFMKYKGNYKIRIPMRKGWRILLRKERDEDGVVYIAFRLSDHSISNTRQGKV